MLLFWMLERNIEFMVNVYLLESPPHRLYFHTGAAGEESGMRSHSSGHDAMLPDTTVYSLVQL